MDFTLSFGFYIHPWLLLSVLTTLTGGIGATVHRRLIAARATRNQIILKPMAAAVKRSSLSQPP
jgi:hypothetical protein